jgi:hypothetical protein
MFSTLYFLLFGGPQSEFKKMTVVNPGALSEQLKSVVDASGSPQQDFVRRTIGSTYDNSAVSMSDFSSRLMRDQSDLLPISRMEVAIELKCVDGEVKWDIQSIWSRTPRNTQYLVNQNDIQTQLSQRQASELSEEKELFAHQPQEDPRHIELLKAQSVLDGATLEGSFLALNTPMENVSRSGMSYESWLNTQFASDASEEAKKIQSALSQMAAQSLYNLFIYHLLTSVSEDGVEYRPVGLIPQTTISHDATTHVTTLILSTCALSEEKFDPADPMSTVRRFYHSRDGLIEIDAESPEFSNLRQAVSQATNVWMELNQPVQKQLTPVF